MSISKIVLKNFTVFDEQEIDFSPGINVFIGENGTGKTHIMKLLYSACQAARFKQNGIDFRQKIINVFRPDDFNIGRLLSRKVGYGQAEVKIFSSTEQSIYMEFGWRTLPTATPALNDSVIGEVWATFDETDWALEADWAMKFEELISVFIPAKEILSNSRNLIQAIRAGNVDFDDTYSDIIAAASVNISQGQDSDRKTRYLETIQGITAGKVKIEKEKFYLLSDGNQSKMEFQLVAEGLRKFALLWQLIKNGALEKGSILFWDEPEANINPKNISDIARLLIELEKDGVQIFVASHDYFFCKYLDLFKTQKTEIAYHALYKKENTIEHEREDQFDLLANNSIISESIRLYEEEVKKVMG